MISPHISERFMRHLAHFAQDLHGPLAEPLYVWTGEKLTSFPTATVDDAFLAIDTAREAHALWRNMHWRRRAQILVRWAESLYQHGDRLIELTQILAGKSRLDALDEWLDGVITSQEIGHIMRDMHQPHRRCGVIPLQTSLMESYDPIGVVGIFTLDDFPVSYGPVDVLQPLAAGNCVIQFAPAQSALASYATRELLESCGLPKGVWQIIPAFDISIGQAVLDELDGVAYIGNTADGADISQQAGERFIPTAMFLSTKNEAVVFDDVDIDEVVPKVTRAVFHMAGQGPCHPERVWVQRSIYQEFLERFEDFVRSELRVGQSWDHTATVGSLYSKARLRRTMSHVEDALQMGATLIHGGQHRSDIGPLFYEPTILTNVPQEAMCYDEETYGPVVSVEPFDDIDWLDERLSRTQYGYHLVLFSHNPNRIDQLVKSTTAGLISVNDAYHAMWGTHSVALIGSRDTGNGVRHSTQAIQQYMKSHAKLTMRWGSLDPSWTHNGTAYEKSYVRKTRLRQLIMRFLRGWKV